MVGQHPSLIISVNRKWRLAPGTISIRIALQARIEGWDIASLGRFLSGRLQYAHSLRKTEAAKLKSPSYSVQLVGSDCHCGNGMFQASCTNVTWLTWFATPTICARRSYILVVLHLHNGIPWSSSRDPRRPNGCYSHLSIGERARTHLGLCCCSSLTPEI